MGKYWQVCRIAWQKNLEYRANAIGHIILGLISIIVPIYIFKFAFEQGAVFGSYTFLSILSYLVLAKFMHFTNRANTSRQIAREIKDGSLSMYLLKPIRYLNYWFFYFCSDRFYEILLRLILLIAFFFFFQHDLDIVFSKNMFWWLAFLPFSLLLNYLFNVIVGFTAFYLTDIKLFSSALAIFSSFFAGELIPLDLLPNTLEQISSWLPFRFAIYFPIMIFQGKLTSQEILLGFIQALAWILVYVLIVYHLWRKGRRNYEAVGQ